MSDLSEVLGSVVQEERRKKGIKEALEERKGGGVGGLEEGGGKLTLRPGGGTLKHFLPDTGSV